jgi:succinoglycan biosynthesis transport protein ExoP
VTRRPARTARSGFLRKEFRLTSEASTSSVSFSDYIAVLKRRKLLVITLLIAAPIMAFLYSLSQEHLYSASAQVLLQPRSPTSAVTGGVDLGADEDPTRVAETQAAIARVPAVARRVVQQVHVRGLTAGKLLNDSSVSNEQNTDLLDFGVTSTDPDTAAQLATAYAQAYTDYRTELDTAQLRNARDDLETRLSDLRASGIAKTSPLYTTLVGKVEQLRTLEALQTSRATLVRPATSGSQIQPRTARNIAFGVVLGILLGIGLALLGEAVDKRVRGEQDVEAALGIPLLGRLAEPPRRFRGRLAMANEPQGLYGEGYRTLKTNIDFVNQTHGARVFMVTSAAEREGKSTTCANLAMTFARAGKRVLLVDLDLRQPSIAQILSLPSTPGITDVAIGAASLRDAITTVAVPGGARMSYRSNGAAKPSSASGLLNVLPAGTAPPNPGEFIASAPVAAVLSELRDQGDIVIIDAPPTLPVGDVMTVSPLVDALLVVVRLPALKRPVLKEFARVLETMPVPKLGFIVTGISAHESYGYVSAEYHQPRAEAERAPLTS